MSNYTLRLFNILLGGLSAGLIFGCQPIDAPSSSQPDAESQSMHYALTTTSDILVTSEAGDKIARKPAVAFAAIKPENTADTRLVIRPDVVKQTMYGVGTSFTESSAFVLAHLPVEERQALMQEVFGKDGANFPLARTHIGATDFSVEGKYSYAMQPGDTELSSFSIDVDSQGFAQEQYPGIKDSGYDLLPMIKEANGIKQAQADATLNIVGSAWTAPAWMKDIETYYIKGTPENNYQGTGGSLKPQYESVYADYLVKYLDAYQQQGINIWGLTPVNEPHGNNGQWESMHFTPETQRDFIAKNLGPALKKGGHEDVQVLIYDQNRDGLEEWTDTILGDKESAQYVYGTAVHWYESTEKVYEQELEKVHKKFPEYTIFNTEATIDDLGKPAPNGIADPEGFQESGWFDNDSFWWNRNATDWAYTASWAPNAEDHPMYTPVHRYARNIIVSFNHWMNGWIDWNIVLDANGGPNHVGNFCGAPIMIDTASGKVYYTPIYYVLSQFSQTIRPGDKAVQADKLLVGLEDDALHTSATVNADGLLSVQILNTTKQVINTRLQIGDQEAPIAVPANALQTVRVQLN